ncbi:hypothetical protein MATL_G00072180 [Megalops atlanticus]|uniref:Cell adhesion molecule-related/down-regulated by oncogenes n=1 Tax=Megalops atlanticus TaxID=7932 RepID=A0A9D3Q4I7_MEGAT|nr:hypothetical protein MATL_G00072180 [Megalops atlanticus]
METRIARHRVSGLIISFVLTLRLIHVAQGSRVWGDLALPEDLEAGRGHRRWERYLAESDDEDFAVEEPSGEEPSGEEDGSTPEPPEVTPTAIAPTIYYRALVNFTDSFPYSPELEDIYSDTFQKISDDIVSSLEALYNQITGVQSVNVVLIKKLGKDIFVELDVGSDYNSDDKEIREVLQTAVRESSVASFRTSEQGFQFRRLGEVVPSRRACMEDEFMCLDGDCILLEYLCDKRPDCLDMSDELDCDQVIIPTTTLAPTPTTTERKVPSPPVPGPCRVDQATCPTGECIPRDYLCDGEKDCPDGSDELKCGTPSPCEPNEFKCQNGRCALKLWRCDGDNDCGDNSDESYCPTKGPGDTCAPEQFVCLGDRTCIPASYQCDEEPDCADRSDEVGCDPPVVTSPPEESIMVARGETVTFTCVAVGVPTPIITWRLNWGHIPVSGRITMTSENGRGTLVIRDVKEADQGAYTCEAINAKGMVFGIPDGVLSLSQNPDDCPDGHFSVVGNPHCVPCFCFGITKSCQSTSRYRSQIRLRFNQQGDFKGVNVSFPSKPTVSPLSSNQLLINPKMEEFQLVDLSRRFLSMESHWTLPRHFLGNKIDSYGGFLRYKVRYNLGRGESEPLERPEVVLVGNGRTLVYRRGTATPPRTLTQKAIKFTEEHWQHSSGRAVTRVDLMMTLVKLESINIRTMYDGHMISVSLSDIVMDTTSTEGNGRAVDVEECRCPKGYSGLSCEVCSPGFERVPGGPYLGTCGGCNCNGHASACDPVSGHCLSCRHNTEGPQCDKCRPGFFGDPRRGKPDDCKPCPCPVTDISRRFSATCFLDTDSKPTCDACRPGYTGRQCERCASGYQGNPLLPNGKCVLKPAASSKCDDRGTVKSNGRPCTCKSNVEGALCDECKPGTFHLSADNPDGCLQCFCMGVTRTCTSSTWNRDQVRGGTNGQLFTLSNGANTRTITEGIIQKGTSEVAFRSFSSVPSDIYYWVLPESFRGDKVTAYGGELRYTVRYEPRQRSIVTAGQPDVVLQGNGIFLEHYSKTKPLPRVPTTITVRFRESAWKRADGQPCTREHLLMALAETAVFMIRATYADSMSETSISEIQMDIAVPHSTGNKPALEVEECACPQGYRGPSCQECDVGYSRTTSGLYLGTCERCDCNGHATSCDSETGECLECLHNTVGPNCERCLPGFYGDPTIGGQDACQPCPCPGTSSNNQFSKQCYLDSDNQPTCDSCPPGFTGRRCERCAAGYTGNPVLGQPCIISMGNCKTCDPRGSDGCDSDGTCRCKTHTEGPSCSSCKQGHFHLSAEHKDGCLPCFCMGVTQQCSSSAYYRHLVSSTFLPGDFQGFALVNQQRTNRIATGFTVEVDTDGSQLSFSNFGNLHQEAYYWQLPEAYQGDKYALVYKGFSLHPEDVLYWQLPPMFKGDKVGSYGGRLRYTLSFVASPRGTPIEDADIQIIGNDITLVARQSWQRAPGTRESREFEIAFKEENWRRPDGMPATREHLMMVLADLDDVLIRASYYTDMLSASISGVSMEVAAPSYSGRGQALEVEQCRCPPGYQGLSCQDCAAGYTRTGGGLYLGHCELCDCNGHSDSCHPETGICTSCLHNTMGELCELCAPGFYGDATAGTPEDCQPCACPHTDPDNQFSPTCESLSAGGYRCTACQPGYTGQYCERCAPGYEGNPQERIKCRPDGSAASLVVKVHPERVVVAQGSPVILRCQVTSSPPHLYTWTREDGRPVSSNAERRSSLQSEELYFASVQPIDAGVYICTCQDQRHTNRSRAEIVVTTGLAKPIQVTIEEPKAQSVSIGSTVTFICTAKSTSPAYTLVWTRRNNGKLPSRAMDFNGILTIQNVQPEDAGIYVCTASNMFAMDEGTAILYVPEASQTQMFYTAYEMFEGHRAPAEASQPVAVINPPVLTIQQGQRAEFRCTATGSPTPSVEWTGGQGNPIPPNAIMRGGVLTIPVVERSNEGEYFCKAVNAHGEHTARAVLYVHSASLPHVQVSPQRVEIHEGETLRLYCRAGGTPRPALSWKKKDGPLPPQAREERTDIGTLIVPGVQAEDTGTYLCVGTNGIGSSEARVEVTVVQGIASEIRIQPPIATVQEGQSLDLSCIVPGDPPPSVTWQRVGRALSSNHQVLGAQLRILRATASDSGEYICRINGGPTLRQASVSVSVTASSARLQTPIISIEPHSTSVRLGESTSLRCRIHSGTQPMRLEWKMTNGRPLQDNVKLGPDGSVLTIVKSRHSNQGTYRCVASNSFGITQSLASLVVKDGPKVTVTPRGIVVVRMGDPINLECQATGEPRPSVSWHRENNAHKTVLNSPLLMDSNAVMQVLVARPEDSGTYTCVAQNSEGSAEAKVEVIVQGGPLVPSVPRASVPEPLMLVVEGQTATLRCDAHGYPTPSVTWSKLRSPVPWQHKVVNNTLILPNVGRQDSGQYICNATNNLGTTEVTVMLDVETPPYATTLPDDLSVRVGEVIRLQCLAHGTPPLHFDWTKVDGSLPAKAEVQAGNLQINLATEADAGTYRCKATNKVGSSEALAKVTVTSPLTVRVSPNVEVKARGSSVEFTCSVNGGFQTTIEWLKEGGPLPPNHQVKDGVLRIENLEQNDGGFYICRATSEFGQAQDSAKLTIQALPKVIINIRTSVQTVLLGSSVEFHCQAIGEPQPTIRWSKVGAVLPAHVLVQGGMLRIEQVAHGDAGQYRCTATNDVGSVQSQVVLNVQSLPQIIAQPEVKDVTVGSTAVFPCTATGHPVPQVTWSKMDEDLPSKATEEAHTLTIPNVTEEDAGTYICTASNKQGKIQAFSTLNVHERVVPYFTQTPLSYLTLPTIKNAYKAFTIKITFRPDNVDGMIIYNGQRKTTGADFISFGLVGGRPEFRFDVGSGMATIRYPTPIKLGEFHTVELYRNQTQGSMVVDGDAPINGSSQGKFQGLDLNEELYVGGYPDYSFISKTTGLNSGFVGCIRQLIIQGDEVIFKTLDRSSTGVSNCPTCRDHPCQNGGVCRDSETSSYKCDCARGFTGSNCEHHSALHCHPEACGPDATCINRQNGLGYDCRCHLGKSGDKCMEGTLVTTPLFDGEDSFIAYPPLTNIHNDLRVELEFKPSDQDGLMFFSGGKKMKVEDFVSLSLVDGHVEFRYELGTGMAILRSRDPVTLEEWHRVTAERLNKDGFLKVDQAPEVRRSSPGKAQGLNIHTPMYLGGVPSMDILPKPANITMLFEGCIGEVSINGKKVDLSYSFIESRAISQCVDSSPCDRRPCLHGGSCLSSAEYEYQCLCREGYEGERCEVVKDACQRDAQCQNGGSCTNHRCVCAAGYTGRFCENDSPIQYSAFFHDDGYLTLPKPMFPRSAPDTPETIELEIRTTSPEGLILWQGVEPIGAFRRLHARNKELGEQGKGKDFISLGLQNGHLVFSYQLGSGEAEIISKEPINDGNWHKLTAVRTGKQGYLQIDGGPPQKGQSQGRMIMVDTKGNIFLGGAPDMTALTGGKFSSGITGCIRNLALTNVRPGEQPSRPIDLRVHAEDGVNVERCSP